MLRFCVALLFTAQLTGCTPRQEAVAPSTETADMAMPCSSVESFRRFALQSSPASDNAALERWRPPAAVADADLSAVFNVARRYLAMCGLEQAAQLTEKLVTFATVSADPSPQTGLAFTALADFLRGFATEAGLAFVAKSDNRVWEISLGTGERRVAFVAHADVTPATSGWTQPNPFVVKDADGRLYGRGTEDDKGPLAAALVVLRALKAMGLVPKNQLALLVGTAEETDWAGMEHYLRHAPRARYTISLNSSYPVVVAESGLVAWRLQVPMTGAANRPMRPLALTASAGQLLTQVPGDASVVLRHGPGQSLEALRLAVEQAASLEATERKSAGEPFQWHVTVDAETGTLTLQVTGKAAHAAFPEAGYNALWPLAHIAKRLDLAPNGAGVMLKVISQFFADDLLGEKMQINQEDPFMGKLYVTPTVLQTDADYCRLDINMRRPQGQTKEQFAAGLNKAFQRMQRAVDARLQQAAAPDIGDPWVSQAKPVLVDTLLAIFREKSQLPESRAVAIRGGTYARLFPDAVSFGPVMPGKRRTAHGPDEYIERADLDLTVQSVLEAILRLEFNGP